MDWFLEQFLVGVLILGLICGACLRSLAKYGKSNPEQAMKWARFTREILKR